MEWLLPVWHQAVTWSNVCLLLIGALGTDFSEIRSKIQQYAYKKMHLKMLSAKWQPFCLSQCDSCICNNGHKQRFLTPGHQGWNDLHSLCRIGMEYYLLNNDDNNIIYWIMMIIIMTMMIIIMIIMMTTMIIGTTTIMIMITIITTTLTMTIMKMIMIKTAQTPCQSPYQDRRIYNKIAWYNWYNRDDVMLILYEMLHTCSVMHTQRRCKFENTKHRFLGMFLHKCNLHCSGRN